MNIKLIALDLDGTLLNSKKEITEGNLRALKRCIEQGIMIVPCTGRTSAGIPKEVRSIPEIRYAITTNGAVVEDMEENRMIDTRLLSWELALELLRFVDSYPVMYDPYIERRGITEAKFFNHLADYGLSPVLQNLVVNTRDLHPNIIDYVEKQQKPVEKINLFFGDMQLRQKLRTILEKRSDILVTSSIPNNLEINDPEATKGDALLRLASHMGIEADQTMSVGDGENDLSMILKAGVGVAMKNGIEEIKEIANYVTGTNEEDGVASAINNLVFGAGM
ncbi:Cof-type HAD-IIB family hydrolase [Clostridium sp. E02]|uniref:Cof-type HAD-IIB family hydrolase n=1 Tax=Clostridium sp. E02 TaxID=2487134 RepID=UPI000F51CDFD|nr:Cof-type HAD-IIB family hydrolase [Clostridium sp. E02]